MNFFCIFCILQKILFK